MKLRSISILTLFISLCLSTFAQETTNKEEAKEKSIELKEKTVRLLRETREEINSLRTIENRISFSSELADLMWFHDADEGRRMFVEITNDFVQILGRYNAELSAFGGVKDSSEMSLRRISPNEKSKAIGKMMKAIGVRRQVAMAIAAHDAEKGQEFITRTALIITDPEIQIRVETQDKAMESAIIAYMAQQDIEKALAFARKALKKKFKRSMLRVLSKLQKKDKDEAEDFAGEILSKVRSDLKDTKSGFSDAESILDYGSDEGAKDSNSAQRNPFKKNDLEDLARDFADALISRSDDVESYMVSGYASSIEKYSKSDAERVKRKFKESFENGDKIKDGVAAAVEAARNAVKSEGVIDSPKLSAEEQRKADQKAKKEEILRLLKEGNLKELPEEQKQKFVGEAQAIIRAIKNPTEKIAGLSGLAAKVKQLGDEKLASELMNEASLLVTQQPKTYLDYMQIWTLVTGYSEVEPDKAFPILEDTIFQLNDTLEAFVKVGEFIDVAGDIIVDNEVQLGTFGGSMTRGIVGQLGGSESIIKNLVEADFDKTKAVADRFGRTELRVLVKMMIMRSVLDNGKNTLASSEFNNNGLFFE